MGSEFFLPILCLYEPVLPQVAQLSKLFVSTLLSQSDAPPRGAFALFQDTLVIRFEIKEGEEKLSPASSGGSNSRPLNP